MFQPIIGMGLDT